jgi:hypothetical protein
MILVIILTVDIAFWASTAPSNAFIQNTNLVCGSCLAGRQISAFDKGVSFCWCCEGSDEEEGNGKEGLDMDSKDCGFV